MNNNCSRKPWDSRTVYRIIRCGLVATVAVAVSGIGLAQNQNNDQGKNEDYTFNLPPNPTTPAALTPPAGNSVYLAGHALGTQGYICLPKGAGVSWTVLNARPEATLFTNSYGEPAQIITHFLSPDTKPNEYAPNPLPAGNPTWQSSFDSSKVWGQVLQTVAAGSDPTCPNAGAVPCLLLQAVGSDQGPNGGTTMTKTTYIQRLNTNGGLAPATGCAVGTDLGKQALVPYSADYYFFHLGQ